MELPASDPVTLCGLACVRSHERRRGANFGIFRNGSAVSPEGTLQMYLQPEGIRSCAERAGGQTPLCQAVETETKVLASSLEKSRSGCWSCQAHLSSWFFALLKAERAGRVFYFLLFFLLLGNHRYLTRLSPFVALDSFRISSCVFSERTWRLWVDLRVEPSPVSTRL